jgi:flagellar basal-body rod protein FlgF
MIQGVYGAATALDVATQAQETTAQNLAHLNVPGYRARGMAFQPFDQMVTGDPSTDHLYGTQVGRVYSNFQGGPLQFTGSPLDLATDGNNFFVLQGPNGPLYSRNGIFTRNPDGQLVSQSGLPVMSDGGGTLTIPPTAGEIRISAEGSVRAGPNVIGKIQTARFTDPRQLTPAGTTLYAAPPDVTPETGKGIVMQGYREGSNVEPATELITMIRTSRYSEAAQKALRALSDALQLTTRPT